jgi:hypothetical protein
MKAMNTEITLETGMPRKNIGFFMTRNHYQHHIISLYFYLGNGRKISITVMNYGGFSLKFFRHHNYS